ncbi:MAG TPA: NAD-dependent epimerase/dehydratase family protein [Candidatus Fraserbacteria bacterium]|nr:NAD-dependent epimerase/dehydratase family protein [Candidatus Fraserbacteria bacterium]
MNVLVTGGAGFIGSHLVDAYLARGDRVTVLDDLSSGRAENLNPQARLVQLDLAGEPSPLLDLFRREYFELVNHHAAQIDVRRSVADPAGDAQINVIGTLNLLEACVQAGVAGIIFASSGGVLYGEVPGPSAAETAPKQPLSPYGVAKLAVEHYLFVFKQLHGLHYLTLRYGNVYGPRQDPQGEAGVVAIFAAKLRSGEPAVIYGDGEQSRDYVHVADVARANLLASERLELLNRRPAASIDELAFNIGTGAATSVNRLYQLLCRQLQLERPAVQAPPRPGELQRSLLDGRKAQRLLGFQPQYDLEAGLGLLD